MIRLAKMACNYTISPNWGLHMHLLKTIFCAFHCGIFRFLTSSRSSWRAVLHPLRVSESAPASPSSASSSSIASLKLLSFSNLPVPSSSSTFSRFNGTVFCLLNFLCFSWNPPENSEKTQPQTTLADAWNIFAFIYIYRYTYIAQKFSNGEFWSNVHFFLSNFKSRSKTQSYCWSPK